MSEVYLAITRTDGGVVHYAFQTAYRIAGGEVLQYPSDENIQALLEGRVSRDWAAAGDPTMVSWRRITEDEHKLFEADRAYRDALEDVGGRLQHNMGKARELHRAVLRHQAGDKLMLLDREWVNHSASGDKPAADRVEARRRALRDAANDPRIDTAASIAELKQIVPADE